MTYEFGFYLGTAVVALVIGYILGASKRNGQFQSLRWENEALKRLLKAEAKLEQYSDMKVGGSC